MSYNVTSVETLVLDAWISARDLVHLCQECDGDMPAVCFLEEHKRQALDALLEGLPDGKIVLRNFRWSGDWSGHCMDMLRLTVAPRIHGRVEAIFTWEGGDSFSGFTIVDGVWTDCDVVRKLVPKKAT